MRLPILLAALLACAGCNVVLQPSGMIAERTADWRRVATNDDRNRLRDWRTIWTAALGSARRAGQSAAIDHEGALLDPDAAIDGTDLPFGQYRCRVVKLGAKSQGNLPFVAYPGFACRVRADRGLQRLSKLGGSQRYVGIVFPMDAIHKVFLGTLVLGDERRALQYAQDPTRDVAGYIERIGPQRWRLVMPKPHFESQIDVMELVPEGASN